MYEYAKETIINDEGYEYNFYLCSKGKLSVGVGHNVTDNGIHPAVLAQLLKDGCIDVTKIAKTVPRSGVLGICAGLYISKFSNPAIRLQFQIDFDQTVKDVETLYLNWATLDESKQTVILNMCFQLGCSRLRKFVKFRKAVLNNDNAGMVREMKDSLYYRQVTKRADRLIKLL